jgi:hypothetical protein
MSRFVARERTERVALTEAAFRIANDRMAGWDDAFAGHDGDLFFCECAFDGCRERIRLRRPDYESIRADPRHFAVLREHILPDLETEIEAREGYSIIEKPSALLPLLTETHPRSEASGAARDEANALAELIAPDDT